MKKEYRYGLEYPHYYFEVIGAGDIEISESSEVTCGGEEGFSLGVSCVSMVSLVEYYQKKKLSN